MQNVRILTLEETKQAHDVCGTAKTQRDFYEDRVQAERLLAMNPEQFIHWTERGNTLPEVMSMVQQLFNLPAEFGFGYKIELVKEGKKSRRRNPKQ